MRDYSVLNGMIENQKSELRTAYDKGYNQGVKDTDFQLAISKRQDEAYKQGLHDAWECIKKICCIIPVEDFAKVFGDERMKNLCDIIMYISPFEAIEKVKEYDEKHFNVPDNCKIEVGDEVYVPDLNEYAIVIEIVSDDDGDFVRIIRSNGKPLLWVKDTVNLTGNHCDSIVDLLKRLEKRNA